MDELILCAEHNFFRSILGRIRIKLFRLMWARWSKTSIFEPFNRFFFLWSDFFMG